MSSYDALTYNIAFSSYRNINISTGRKLLEHGVTPEVFFNAEASALSSVTGLKLSFFDDACRQKMLREAVVEAEFVRQNGIETYFMDSNAYPSRLSRCDDAPAMLYKLGKADLDSRHIVAVVGTRHATAYGIEFTSGLIKELAESLDDLLVVSGLAYGIDVAAHKAALAEGIPTAAVFAHGLNTIYPAEHRGVAAQMVREGGCLLTEYRTSDVTHRGNFLARNRIVAGLADVVIVVESDRKGGAMATARIASAYNREVMAVPGRVYDPFSRGCNDLIADNTAAVVRDVSDILAVTGWIPEDKSEGRQQELFKELNPRYAGILEYIRQHPDATVNDICVGMSMNFAMLSSALFEMEMDDLVIALPGGRYGIVGD